MRARMSVNRLCEGVFYFPLGLGCEVGDIHAILWIHFNISFEKDRLHKSIFFFKGLSTPKSMLHKHFFVEWRMFQWAPKKKTRAFARIILKVRRVCELVQHSMVILFQARLDIVSLVVALVRRTVFSLMIFLVRSMV